MTKVIADAIVDAECINADISNGKGAIVDAGAWEDAARIRSNVLNAVGKLRRADKATKAGKHDVAAILINSAHLLISDASYDERALASRVGYR